jgi:hypothetical protein
VFLFPIWDYFSLIAGRFSFLRDISKVKSISRVVVTQPYLILIEITTTRGTDGLLASSV